MKLKCIIVDDESLARKLIEDNIHQLPFLELIATCKNPFEAMQVLQEKEVDLMFLDIQMPGMLGTTFLQGLRHRPMVIFVTAYSNYAVESYDLDVVDYLLKPVSQERFTKACYKALEEKQKSMAVTQESSVQDQSLDMDTIFVNSEYSIVKVSISTITYVESMKDYVKIYTTTSSKAIITKSTLKGIEERLPDKKFMKVHKSFIVNLDMIDSVRNQNIIIGSSVIPVSDAHQENFMRVLNLKRL
ncbi:MAG: LytTR family DNA-binding domain-containing protein [Saprospiraceae bacterium]|nr:response regulator transcription factor [Saprospiraceae bacterium]